MPIRNVNIHNYHKPIGGKQSLHDRAVEPLRNAIRTELAKLNVESIDLYTLTGEAQAHNAGRAGTRLVMYSYATRRGVGDSFRYEQAPQTIGGIENNFKDFLKPLGKSGNTIITSEHGVPIAEWHDDTWELCILFDIFHDYSVDVLNIFKYIMKQFNTLVWEEKAKENSWKFAKDRQKLTARFTARIKRQKEQQLQRDKEQVTQWENKIDTYRREIKNYSDSMFTKMRSIAIETENIKNVSDGLIKDLDLILQNPKVEDLQLIDEKFIIFTAPLYITSDRGKRYYGGKYRIELNPDNSDVFFFGDNPRQGYWTDQDPHPHVSGRDGHACLGNVSSTIAELCAQMQIYALAMVCIDFLEAANTTDVAGRNVGNWDEVGKDGKVQTTQAVVEAVEDDNNDYSDCPICDTSTPNDELVEVYDAVEWDEDNERWNATNSTWVCEGCRNDYYHWNDTLDEYIKDGADEEMED